jgi:hypothetical protein
MKGEEEENNNETKRRGVSFLFNQFERCAGSHAPEKLWHPRIFYLLDVRGHGGLDDLLAAEVEISRIRRTYQVAP